jgi:hypothetical protein
MPQSDDEPRRRADDLARGRGLAHRALWPGVQGVDAIGPMIERLRPPPRSRRPRGYRGLSI